MKCYYHPTEEALSVCKSCGKGICRNCDVEILHTSYCKTCVEEGRVYLADTAKYAQPAPPAKMSKAPFIVGAVGALMSGFLGVFGVVFNWFFGLFLLSPYPYNRIGLLSSIAAVVFAVGLILLGVGYRGFKTNYGLTSGKGAFALSIVAAVFFLVFVGFERMRYAVPSNGRFIFEFTGWLIALIAVIILGVAQIIFGVAHINSRRFTGQSGLGIGAGILFIISGAITTAVLLSFIGMILFFVSTLLAFVAFITAK